MAALARQRLAGRARVEVADLEQPLGMVPNACIGLVVASLVLHYVKDWRPLLAELHRGSCPVGPRVLDPSPDHRMAAPFARFERREARRSTPPWIVIFFGSLGRRPGGRHGPTTGHAGRYVCGNG
jgi:Methyltransferase domain